MQLPRQNRQYTKKYSHNREKNVAFHLRLKGSLMMNIFPKIVLTLNKIKYRVAVQRKTLCQKQMFRSVKADWLWRSLKGYGEWCAVFTLNLAEFRPALFIVQGKNENYLNVKAFRLFNYCSK